MAAHTGSSPKYQNEPRKESVTVVVKNLVTGTTPRQLMELAGPFGDLLDVDIPTKTATYRHFIFGFVRYGRLAEALGAVAGLDGAVVGGRRIRAELARTHWRNTNHNTVVEEVPTPAHTDVAGRLEPDQEEELSEAEVNEKVLQLSYKNWQTHCRNNPDKDLASFHDIMAAVIQHCQASPAHEDYDSDD